MALRYFSAKHPASVRCLAYILGIMLLIVSVGPVRRTTKSSTCMTKWAGWWP